MRNNIEKRLQALEQPANDAKACNELVILRSGETMLAIVGYIQNLTQIR